MNIEIPIMIPNTITPITRINIHNGRLFKFHNTELIIIPITTIIR